MSSAAALRLEAGLQQLGFENAVALAERLLQYADLLLAAGKRTNLVGAKNVDELIAAHFLDSLAPLSGLSLPEPIVDLGSGAGLPGIPAALAWPQRHFVLLEPRSKRAEFLTQAVAALGIANVEVHKTSAESTGPGSWRGRAGTVLARALAKPARTIELALPMLKPRGLAVLYQGRASAPSTAEQAAIRGLGGRLLEARRVVVPYLDAQRHVWLIEGRDSAKGGRRGARGPRRS